jgi:hypothetical protein
MNFWLHGVKAHWLPHAQPAVTLNNNILLTQYIYMLHLIFKTNSAYYDAGFL